MSVHDIRVATQRQTQQRLAKLRTLHQQHPDWTQTDLRMCGFESYYMVSEYWAMRDHT
ncbi:MAG: hypothetical protein ACXQTE_01375 [Methanosarcinaceae archaeon]